MKFLKSSETLRFGCFFVAKHPEEAAGGRSVGGKEKFSECALRHICREAMENITGKGGMY